MKNMNLQEELKKLTTLDPRLEARVDKDGIVNFGYSKDEKFYPFLRLESAFEALKSGQEYTFNHDPLNQYGPNLLKFPQALLVEKRLRKETEAVTYGFTVGEHFYPFSTLEFAQQALGGLDAKWKLEDFCTEPLGNYGPDLFKSTRKKDTMTQTYSFTSRPEDVDFIRILKEAPKDTPFILVTTHDKKTHHQSHFLFVHNSVLSNPAAKGMKLGGKLQLAYEETSISPDWGFAYAPCGVKQFHIGDHLYSYRCMAIVGKPGILKSQIERIKAAISPKRKSVVTTVDFL